MVTCPHCAHTIELPIVIQKKLSKRKVTFCSALVSALAKAYFYCAEKNSQTVHISDLALSTSEYARMNDLVRFGLAYKKDDMGSGQYGIPRTRVRDFFKGEWSVASHYWHNPITDTNEMSTDRIFVSHVPKVKDLLLQLGPKLSQYQQISFI